VRKIVDGKRIESFMGLTCEWDEVIIQARFHINDDYARGFSDTKPDWDNISLTVMKATDDTWEAGLTQLLGTVDEDEQADCPPSPESETDSRPSSNGTEAGVSEDDIKPVVPMIKYEDGGFIVQGITFVNVTLTFVDDTLVLVPIDAPEGSAFLEVGDDER
jgi:hypothetical protein